jgi:hypothetical protein
MEKLKTVQERKDQVWRRYKRVCQSPNIQSIYSPAIDDLFFSDQDPVPLPTEIPENIKPKEINVKDLEPLAEKIQEEALKPKYLFFSASPYEFITKQEMEHSIENDFFNHRETQRPINFISNVNNYSKLMNKLYNNLQYFNDFKEILQKLNRDYNFLVLVKTDDTFINFLCECNCRCIDFPDKLNNTTNSILRAKEKIAKLEESKKLEIPKPQKKPEPPTEEEEIFGEFPIKKSSIKTEKPKKKLKNIRTKPTIKKEEPTIQKPNLPIPIITNLNKKPTQNETETPKENDDDDLFGSQSGSPVHYILPSNQTRKFPKKEEEDEPEQY